MFTGRKLSDFLPGDYVGARKVINGTDKAQLIASYAEIFERALQAAGVSEKPEARRLATEKPIAKPVGVPPSMGKGIAALLATIIAALAAWLKFGG